MAGMTEPAFPVLPAPTPLERPPGFLAFIRGMTTNPVSLWTREHFEKPFVRRMSTIGPMMTVSEPETIRRVLLDNAANYRKDALQMRVLRPLFGNGILTAEGENWRRLRRITAPLFVPRAVAGHADGMDAASRGFVRDWTGAHAGTVAPVSEAMAELTLAVLARTLFAEGLGRDGAAIRQAITRYLDTVGRLDPLDLLNFPDWVPRLRRRRGRAAMATLSGIVDGIVAERRRSGARPGDLTDALLQARDPETGEGLDDGEIRDTLLTFLAAGHETTANALSWTAMLLALHPSVREACEAEVARIDASGATGAIAAEALVLVRAVIEEAMRLYPPAAVITREAVADDDTPVGPIPAGTIVVISPWVLHRHRRLWDEPERFRPERFLPENRGDIRRFSYIPFGAGPRVCIGAGFALQEAVLALAAILRCARLDLPPGMAPPMPVQRITLRPENGLPMQVTLREGRG
jgi:cytochrome P450